MPAPVGAASEVYRVVISLAALTAMLALASRRTLVVPLMLQYVLVATLSGADLADPIFFLRLTLGAAISIIVYITGAHLDKGLADADPGRLPRGLGRSFSLVAMAWAMLTALGVWNAYPLTNLSASLVLAAYTLVLVGATMTMVSADPVRMGVGALLLLSGVEAVYLTLEPSLLVVALMGILSILVALAVSYGSESWLDAALGGQAR